MKSETQCCFYNYSETATPASEFLPFDAISALYFGRVQQFDEPICQHLFGNTFETMTAPLAPLFGALVKNRID